LNCARANPFECLSHPVACISVVSTENEDAFKSLSNLFNPNALPEELQKCSVDPDMLRYYVVVHDTQSTIDKKM
jgi:trafficking protein particle complex subunit 8